MNIYIYLFHVSWFVWNDSNHKKSLRKYHNINAWCVKNSDCWWSVIKECCKSNYELRNSKDSHLFMNGCKHKAIALKYSKII